MLTSATDRVDAMWPAVLYGGVRTAQRRTLFRASA